jgi:hypothetical protein
MIDGSAPRDAHWCRQEAARLREKAAAVSNNAPLHDSYLAVAREYEKLAIALEPGTGADTTVKRDRKSDPF